MVQRGGKVQDPTKPSKNVPEHPFQSVELVNNTAIPVATNVSPGSRMTFAIGTRLDCRQRENTMRRELGRFFHGATFESALNHTFPGSDVPKTATLSPLPACWQGLHCGAVAPPHLRLLLPQNQLVEASPLLPASPVAFVLQAECCPVMRFSKRHRFQRPRRISHEITHDKVKNFHYPRL